MLEVRLLGKFDVYYGKKTINIASRPAQSLFAYLILHAGTSHRREKLAGMLWPDSLEETARDNLRHALWRMRKALPSKTTTEYLLADDLSIAFNGSAEYWLDAAEFEKLNESASADELMAVLSEYQGELLPGFYDEWVVLEREHLQSVFEHKMARLMSILQNENRWLDILDWGERWIKLGQKPEPAYRVLMSAHAAKGDMSKVAGTYERCVKSLREFGIEPSEQTKALFQDLKSGKEFPKPVPVVTKPIAKGTSSNIPVPLTSFIGREKELDEIVRLVSKNRLLTLTGSGGVGKTRLAIQSSKKLAGKFKDGVWWVDLASLNDPILMPQAIAKVVGVCDVSSEPIIETLKNHLKSKDLLLVLDNCEHLIEASAKYAEHLLAACPNLKILATSRERLGIFNETAWHVPSLPLPEGRSLPLKELKGFASVGLFVERTQNVRPDFALTHENAVLVSQICRRLDGIPLALELASARVKVISLEEILLRLDDRFSLLTAGSRTALPHQQTLRATIDWSYELLTGPERILFRRLAVFAGGFQLEAVEIVCGFGDLERENVLDLLARLVDKSLAIVHNTSSNGGTRYRLLETIREYAREKLEVSGKADLTRDRHLEFFMKLAEEAELYHFSSEQLIWFDRVETEIDNMRAALVWSIADDRARDAINRAVWRQETGLRAIGALVWFWHRSYARETSERLKQMLAITDKPTLGRARALYSLGFLYWTVNNFSEARLALEEALTISRKLEDGLTLARSLGYLGAVAAAEGDYASTQSLLEESLGIARQFGPAGRKAASWALAFLGDVPYAHGDYASSWKLYEEAVALIKESHEKNMLGLMIRRLGYVALKLLDKTRATEYFKESLELNQKMGHSVGICASLTAFANLALTQGKASQAAQLFGAVESYLNNLSSPLFYSDEIEYQLGVLNLRKSLMDVPLEKAWVKGARMTIEQAVELAMKGARV